LHSISNNKYMARWPYAFKADDFVLVKSNVYLVTTQTGKALVKIR